MYSAGSVKIAPATTAPDAPPMPVMMTFSRSVDRRRYTRARPIARIEIGIAASMTCPTFSPEYADATVKMTPKTTPQPIDRHVACGGSDAALTMGWYRWPGSSLV